MTQAEIAIVLAEVSERWDRHPIPAGTGDHWFTDLAGFDQADVLAAVRRLDDGRFVPPTAGLVAKEVSRALQGPAPGFEEMLAAVWRAIPVRVFLRRLYDPNGRFSATATAEAIALMQTGDAHEAACRFLQALGLRTVWLIPDGSMYSLDPNQQADRRDMARQYRAAVIPDWERDPRIGLALQRACRAANLDAGELLEGAAELRRLEALRPRPALPAPADYEPVPEGTGIDPALVIAEFDRERELAEAERREERNQKRLQDWAERQAAERELAEHAARKGADS